MLRELLRANPSIIPVKTSDLSLEDNFALLMSEHRLSLRITPSSKTRNTRPLAPRAYLNALPRPEPPLAGSAPAGT